MSLFVLHFNLSSLLEMIHIDTYEYVITSTRHVMLTTDK